jgi:selenocysteine-specific elongation factor
MAVIGTAGHVDHGKSTLIEALTGRNPDRLLEEKARGLTIDLGFSWMTLPEVGRVSFVDVPGHERFIKNMLAGIEAIDVAMLVVAADEGWMPQSEEHAAVLDLLEISSGVVALTKIDKVDRELIEIAESEISDRIAGTSLEGFSIVPVSAMTMTGLDQLCEALGSAITSRKASVTGRTRMWVDRSFSIRGAGTVVTGTLQDGELAIGDRISIWPGDLDARVRAMESHEEQVERALPGWRLAVNLQGVSTEEVARGSLLHAPGIASPFHRFAATMRLARYATALPAKGDYQVHIGSGVWNAQLRSVVDDIAYLDLAQPVPLEMGDRFILRDTGRRMVVAGGRVLLPDPPKQSRVMRSVEELRAAFDMNPDERSEVVLEVVGRVELSRLTNYTGGGRPKVGLIDRDQVLANHVVTKIRADLREQVRRFHELTPLRPGLPVAQAAEQARLSVEALKSVVAETDDLVLDQHVVRSADFVPELDNESAVAWTSARRILSEGGLASLPRTRELGLNEEAIHALNRQGELVRISDEFVCLPEQIAEFIDVLDSFQGFFSVGDFKEKTGLSRKYAIPLLDWADRVGHTVRVGDLRKRGVARSGELV